MVNHGPTNAEEMFSQLAINFEAIFGRQAHPNITYETYRAHEDYHEQRFNDRMDMDEYTQQLWQGIEFCENPIRHEDTPFNHQYEGEVQVLVAPVEEHEISVLTTL